jgi:hypothetical protein
MFTCIALTVVPSRLSEVTKGRAVGFEGKEKREDQSRPKEQREM